MTRNSLPVPPYEKSIFFRGYQPSPDTANKSQLMSTEKIKRAAEQTGYLVAANKLIEEAVLLEQAPQNSHMAINICLKVAKRLRERADELQTKAVEMMLTDNNGCPPQKP